MTKPVDGGSAQFVHPTPDTVWLNALSERLGEVEWRLRHAPNFVTAADRMVAAMAISNFRELVRGTRARREKVVRTMKAAK